MDSGSSVDDISAGMVNLTTTSGNITIDAHDKTQILFLKELTMLVLNQQCHIRWSLSEKIIFGNAVQIGAHDLVVDTDTLFVDASADNVGIGTTSLFSELDIRSTNRTRLNMQDGGNSEVINHFSK